MTRDDAISEVWRKSPNTPPGTIPGIVDALGALGLLKFDEPKTGSQLAYQALIEGGFTAASTSNAIALIQKAGLEICESKFQNQLNYVYGPKP